VGIEDVWDQDDSFDAVFGAGIPIPPGFEAYRSGGFWRERFGDRQRGRLSLVAVSDDISGLRAVPIRGLWRLDLQRRRLTDDDFDLVARFDKLEELNVSHTPLTDNALLGLHTLQQLRILALGSCAITDTGMEHVAALRKLEDLDLSQTKVTDDGLRALAFHPALHLLNLRDSEVTGERLAPLVTMPALRRLCLSGRQHRHARPFERERPDVEILY
jgi:hypothetical protein